ncbi:AFG1/ZapE family ATPase [bacterium RCC_150]
MDKTQQNAPLGAGSFSSGKIITPGTPTQLGAFGLFPPSRAQERVLTPTNHRLSARSAEDMLWVSFPELCGTGMSRADYLALAEDFGTWVIDSVPSPNRESLAAPASAWQRFGEVVEVLHEQDITLFLLGPGPLDWELAQDPAIAAISDRLSLLGRVESPDPLEEAETAGS